MSKDLHSQMKNTIDVYTRVNKTNTFNHRYNYTSSPAPGNMSKGEIFSDIKNKISTFKTFKKEMKSDDWLNFDVSREALERFKPESNKLFSCISGTDSALGWKKKNAKHTKSQNNWNVNNLNDIQTLDQDDSEYNSNMNNTYKLNQSKDRIDKNNSNYNKGNKQGFKDFDANYLFKSKQQQGNTNINANKKDSSSTVKSKTLYTTKSGLNKNKAEVGEKKYINPKIYCHNTNLNNKAAYSSQHNKEYELNEDENNKIKSKINWFVNQLNSSNNTNPVGNLPIEPQINEVGKNRNKLTFKSSSNYNFTFNNSISTSGSFNHPINGSKSSNTKLSSWINMSNIREMKYILSNMPIEEINRITQDEIKVLKDFAYLIDNNFQ